MCSISWFPGDWLVGLREDISWVIRLVTYPCTDMGRVNKKDGVAPSNTKPIFYSQPSSSLAQSLLFIPIQV